MTPERESSTAMKRVNCITRAIGGAALRSCWPEMDPTLSNPPIPLTRHDTRGRLCAQKDTSKVHADEALPLFKSGFEKRLVKARAGVVDQHVQTSEAVEGLTDHAIHRGGRG